MIRLWMFGVIDLRSADGSELRSIITQPKRLALLTYLALHHGRFVSRDRALAVFWPEQDDEHARSALSRALYYLRQALGDGVVVNRGDDEIGIASEHFWCDATAFEAAASSGAHRDALELYRGEVLEGFHLANTQAFEEWAAGERDRLRDLARRSAWALAEAELAAGNPLTAAHWARWAAERAPYDETSLQRLVSLLDNIGDRAGAVYAYEQFAQRLAHDLELTPAPETRALVDAIRLRERVGANGHTIASLSTHYDESNHSPEVVGVPDRQRIRLRLAVGAVTGYVLLLLGALALWRSPKPAPDAKLVFIDAVVNRTGDARYDAVARSAFDWMARSVVDAAEAATPLSSMTGGRVLRGEAEKAQPDSMGQSGIIVRGELYRDRDDLRFHVSVVDRVHGGRAWAIPPITVPVDSSGAAIRELGERAAAAVMAVLHPALAEWLPAATTPPTYDALVEFVRARESPKPWTEGPRFERAAALDTTFTLALIEAAHADLGADPVRSRELTTLLNEKRDRLPRLQVHLLNYVLASQAGDRTAMHDAMAGAAAIAPAHYQRRYAMSAHTLYRPRETLRLLDRADRAVKQPLPPNWMFRTILYHEIGEHRKEAALARRARRLHPRKLDAMYAHVRALAATGRVKEVNALLDSALAAERDQFYTPGNLMQIAAEELRAHGYLDASAAALHRAIEWFSTHRDESADSTTHAYSLAGALYMDGQLSEARTLMLHLAAEPSPFRADLYGRLGAIAARTGDRATANHYLTALTALPLADGPASEALMARARITAVLGDDEGALQLLRDAIGGQGTDLHGDVDFESLRKNRAFREFITPKG
jgi:DNA-binding SARP family transcriptional activator